MTITKENFMNTPYYKDLYFLFEEFHDTPLSSAIIEHIMVRGKDVNKLIYNTLTHSGLWYTTIDFFKKNKNRERLRNLINNNIIRPNSISSRRQMFKFLNKIYGLNFIIKEGSKKNPIYKLNQYFYLDFLKKFFRISIDASENINTEHFSYRNGTFKEINLSQIKKMKIGNAFISIFGGKNIIKSKNKELIINSELKSIINKVREEHHRFLMEEYPATSSNLNIRAFELSKRHWSPIVLQILLY